MTYPTPIPSVEYVVFPRNRQRLARYRFRVPGTGIRGDIIAATCDEARSTFCRLHRLAPDSAAIWCRLPLPSTSTHTANNRQLTADLFGPEVRA